MEKGKILIKGLEDDEYTVTEIKTADGYTLLKKGIAVVISRKDAPPLPPWMGNRPRCWQTMEAPMPLYPSA